MNDLDALIQIRSGIDALIAARQPPVEPPAEPEVVTSPPAADVIAVADPAGLWAALKAARGGETIRLAPGAHGAIKLMDFQFDEPVTVLGFDAIAEELLVRKCRGLRLSGFELVAVHAKGSDPFKVLDSENILLSDLYVHGSLDGDASNDTSAMQIRNSRNVALVQSAFQQLANAVTHLDCDGVLFEGNSFSEIRMDGIRGGGTSNLKIAANTFTDFRPMTGRPGIEDDHGDAIQVWTSNTTKSATNIVIVDNVITQGSGGLAQGIFVTMQTSHRYKDVEIRNNVVVGGLTNGIMVTGADGVKLEGNKVAALEGGQKVWIRLENVTGVELTGNQANAYYRAQPVELVTERGNDFALPALSSAAAAAIR